MTKVTPVSREIVTGTGPTAVLEVRESLLLFLSELIVLLGAALPLPARPSSASNTARSCAAATAGYGTVIQ